MDLIEQEIKIKREDKKITNVNFNLSKVRTIALYTKWKRDLIDPNEDSDFFKDFEKNRRRQRQLRRKMREFISQLQVPLYNGLK